MNTTELKKLAEAATGGTWVVGSSPYDQSRHIYCNNPVSDGDESWLPLIACTDDAETRIDYEANAAYIAAANPAAILDLLAIKDELVEALKQIKTAAGATVCNIQWVERHAAKALAKAEGGEL